MAPSEKGGFLLGRNRHTSGAGSRQEIEDERRNRSQEPTGLGIGAVEMVVAGETKKTCSLRHSCLLGLSGRWTVLVCDSRDRQRIRNEP